MIKQLGKSILQSFFDIFLKNQKNKECLFSIVKNFEIFHDFLLAKKVFYFFADPFVDANFAPYFERL